MITDDQANILETARQFAQFDDAGWRTFVAERCDGIESPRDLSPLLYESLVDWFVALGFRDPRVPMVSPDFVRLMVKCRRKARLSDERWSLVLLGTGYAGPDHEISGLHFVRAMTIFQALGVIPGLPTRSVIGARQVGLIHQARIALGLDDETYTHLLMDLGGGVLTSQHLDRRGFERVFSWFILNGFEGACPVKSGSGRPAPEQMH